MKNTFTQHVVEQVTDADSYILEDGRRIRLFGVDAPETYPMHQAYGGEATKYAEELLEVYNNRVYVDEISMDRYGRTVARLLLGSPDEDKGLDLSLALLISGCAWAYRRYLVKSPLEGKYVQAEGMAKNSRSGLWKTEAPMNPSDFRKQIRKRKRKPKVKAKTRVGGKFVNIQDVGVNINNGVMALDKAKEKETNIIYDPPPSPHSCATQ